VTLTLVALQLLSVSCYSPPSGHPFKPGQDAAKHPSLVVDFHTTAVKWPVSNEKPKEQSKWQWTSVSGHLWTGCVFFVF
jgi:hypothetical protein